MKTLGLVTIALFFTAQAAAASPNWTLISFATTPQNAPKVLAAADELMNSAAGKQFPGRLLLQLSVADGANPATHSFVPIYKSAADREGFVAKLQADPAWPAFQGKMASLSQPVSTVMYSTLKSWGAADDSDEVWEAHAFSVSDPAGFLAAIGALMASPTGKKFPGQVHLSAVSAGGITPVTHLISVGFQSEVEREAWNDMRNATSDWAAYIESSRKVSEFLGTSLARDIKEWGAAPLAELVAP